MQNTEPPKDAGEGEQKGNPSPSHDALLVYLRLGESPSLGCPSHPSMKPLPGAAEVGSAAAISPAAPALPRPPAWFFPAVEVGPGAGVRGESAPAAGAGKARGLRWPSELALQARGAEVSSGDRVARFGAWRRDRGSFLY